MLTPRFNADPHLRFKQVEKVPDYKGYEEWKLYTYKKAGVQGEVVKRPTGLAYFYQFRINSKELPRNWQRRGDVVGALSIEPKQSSGNTISLGCETYTVDFHFDNDQLRYVEIYIASVD